MAFQFEDDYIENETFSGVSILAGEVSDIQFSDCLFRSCNFSETTFRGCRFRGCRFEDCDLNMIKVPDSVFVETEFADSKLMAVDWTRAAWGKAAIFQLPNSIQFSNCVLNYSVFFGLQMKKIKIEKCLAREVDFSDANLESANFKGTDLEKAVFRNSNLSGANFVGAKNYFIPAQYNVLKDARFSLPEAMALLYGMEIVIERETDDPTEEQDP